MVKNAHVVGALERFYGHHEGDLEAWTQSVVEAADPLLNEAGLVGIIMSEPARPLAMYASGLAAEKLAALRQLITEALTQSVPPDMYEAAMRPPQMVALQSELGIVHTALDRLHALIGGNDMVGITTEPSAHVSLVLCFNVLNRGRPVSPAERADLTRLGLHLEAAARARLRPESVIGTVTPAGRLELGAYVPPRDARDDVVAQVDLIEELRTKAHRSEGDRALGLWKALATGALSLLERIDTDGKRLYDLHENPPLRRPLRALSAQEQQVVSQAARGLANKEIAYATGISTAYVSRLLGTAARKLGLPSGRALLQLAARLTPSSRPLDQAGLTAAEREVMELLAAGYGNREIAAVRGVAQRTVANQVAAVLAKTGAGSRRGLLGKDAEPS